MLIIRGCGRSASSYQEALQLWGRSLITECIHVKKHLAGSNHLKIQAVSGLRVPMSTKRTPVVQHPCAELKMEVARGPRGG